MNKSLIIFAREPLPGRVKTRLAQVIGDQAATDFYAAMLEDTLEQASRLASVQPLMFWSLENSRMPILKHYPQLPMYAQQGNDLGERMATAFEQVFNNNCSPCCIIGTDSPDLPSKYVLQAFEQLERNETDVVFGPAEDGGYYLIGLRQNCPGLFDSIPWSTSLVLEKNLRQAKRLGLRTSLLPTWYDIDTIDDLRRLDRSPITTAARTHRAAQQLLLDLDTK
jgi:hypothetical protein